MESYIWLAIAVVMAFIEALSLGLITIWFVIGAIAAFVVAHFGGDIALQISTFLVVSIACLGLFRPLIMKHRAIGQQHEATPVGQIAIVIEAIDNDALTGRVETPDHMSWAALSADGTPIEKGEKVSVVDNRSIKLVVERTKP